MADMNNPGQFGNREDTEAQAKKGGKASHSGGRSSASTSGRGSTTSGRGSKEGQRKGGKHSHDNQYTV